MSLSVVCVHVAAHSQGGVIVTLLVTVVVVLELLFNAHPREERVDCEQLEYNLRAQPRPIKFSRHLSHGERRKQTREEKTKKATLDDKWRGTFKRHPCTRSHRMRRVGAAAAPFNLEPELLVKKGGGVRSLRKTWGVALGCSIGCDISDMWET